MSLAEALRDWFRSCPAVLPGNRFNVDYLPSNPTEYAIYVSPTAIKYKTDILGEVYVDPVQSVNFVFASRDAYSADTLQNLANLGFYDEVIAWMLSQNKHKNFPSIDEGRIISIMPTLTQYLFAAGASSGRYQISCTIKYRRY